MKKVAIVSLLVFLFVAIASLFWYNEWVYSLPTPVPVNYKAVHLKEKITVKGLNAEAHRPVFLHFFNPDCPCSKFNISHFRSLVTKYGSKVNFAVVVMSENKHYTITDIQEKFNVQIPVLFDNSIAEACGVYSTPQAVIIDTDGQLYYRGNYNRSRYCTDEKTNYANIALDSLLHQSNNPVFSRYALQAYGCELPTCTK